MRHLRRPLLLLLPWMVAGCLDTPKKETAPSSPMSRSLETRILSRDPNKRSSFEKALPSSMQPKSDTSGFFGRKIFGTKESVQTKPLAGVREFQVPKTSLGSKSTRMGRQQAREGSQTAPGMDNTFSTPASRMATQSSRLSGESFRGSGDEFSTFSNFAGTKAVEKNTRPKIIQKANGGTETAYTEDQVRALMNRN